MKKVSTIISTFKDEKLPLPIISKDLVFMTLLFIIFVPASFDQATNEVSLYLLIPFLFAYSITVSPKLLIRFHFFRLFLLLFFWMLLSGVAAKDMDLYLAEIRAMIGVVMFAFTVITFSWTKPRHIYFLYILYIVKFLFIIFYAYQKGLFASNISTERFGLEELNSNVFGYFGFFALISSFLLAQYSPRKQKIVFEFVFYSVFCLVIVAGFFAASRAALLITVLAFSLLLLIRFFFPFSKKTVIFLAAATVSFFTITYYFENTFENSLLKSRLEINEDSRSNLFARAIEVGKDNLIFGVGSGNFILYTSEKQFSHSSYSELWANNGAVALIIYFLMLGEFFVCVGRYYKLSRNKKVSGYFFVIGMTYCLYNMFYVFYISFTMLAFLFLVRIHLEHLKTLSYQAKTRYVNQFANKLAR